MPRSIPSLAALAIALTIAACGSSATPSTSTPKTTGTSTVAVQQISGVGRVLVAANGMALYTPVQEASGAIRCAGACVAIWKPLAPDASRPTGSGSVGTIAVVKRPDGSRQVTVNGRPVYTFAQDSSGSVTGNGVSDAFGSQHFTWHAVLAGGAVASGSASSSGSSSGGSSSGGSSRGAY
jgi:predicted lipoprotein with Yx(FWY)xxD motif